MPPLPPRAPLVTVAIPLYESTRFLDIIRRNIDAIDYPNVEILISDRHGRDDAIERLREVYGRDPRITFLQATDALNWVQHFNALLERAAGTYALWMAHDDTYPPGYIRALVEALEAQPDAVLAFGQVESLSLDGFLPVLPFAPPPLRARSRWTLADALRLLTTWQLWIAFRGVVRCETVRSRRLYIRETPGNIRADIYWVFALALVGRLVYVPGTSCLKRFYRSSTGATWRVRGRHTLDGCRVLGRYILDYGGPWTRAALALTVVWPWCLIQAALPRGAARRLMHVWQVRVRGGYGAKPIAPATRSAGRTSAPS